MYSSALGIVDYLVYMLYFVRRSAALCWFLGMWARTERRKSEYVGERGPSKQRGSHSYLRRSSRDHQVHNVLFDAFRKGLD
jgi:hypothetical protein